MAPLRCAAKFDPFLSLDCVPTPSGPAQSKETKGSNFAIWQPCMKEGGSGNCGEGRELECAFAGRDHIRILDPLKPGNGSVVGCIASCDVGHEERTFPAEFFSRCV